MVRQRYGFLAVLVGASTMVAVVGGLMQQAGGQGGPAARGPGGVGAAVPVVNIPAGPGQSIKALLITGGCCHDYATQKMVLAEGISKLANIEWTLVQEGGTGMDYINPRFNDPDWAKPFDVVVHDPCFANTKDVEYIRKILKPHAEGKAAVVLHCAMHTFRDSPNADEWREFLGISTHDHEPSTMLEVKPVAAEAKHPILAGFPEVWKTPVRDEAYIVMKQWPNTTALATVYGRVNDKDFTCAWTNLYKDKARVFGTTMGHSTEVVRAEAYIGMVGRGMLWAADKLGADGKVVAGYEPRK